MQVSNDSRNETIDALNLGEKIMVGVLGIFSPIVGLVALPILTFRYTYELVNHRSLYQKTLDGQGKRQEFGRLPGQDYTQWDGRSIERINPTEMKAFQMHKSLDLFPYIKKSIEKDCYPFNHKKDKEWLRGEINRLRVRQKMKLIAQQIIECFLALIPSLGVFLILKRREKKTKVKCLECPEQQKHFSSYKAACHHLTQMKERIH